MTINCHFPKFPKKRAATITIKSRLWNSTLVEDYSQVDWVRIVSYAGVMILDPTVKQDDVSNDVAMVSSTVLLCVLSRTFNITFTITSVVANVNM